MLRATLKLHFLFAVMASSAVAAPLTVSSYTTLNGATGSFDYRDFTYLPCPASNCTTTAAALSGGTGKLTDGVSPVLDWFQQGSATSWVGWDSGQGLANPTVTFFFSQSVTVNTVTIWETNSRSGGVAQPGSIVIGGVSHPLSADTINLTPHAVTFTSLNLTGSSIAIQFNQAAGFQWLMIGEVSFDGSVITATPEPASLTLFVLASAGMMFFRRRLTLKDPSKNLQQ